MGIMLLIKICACVLVCPHILADNHTKPLIRLRLPSLTHNAIYDNTSPETFFNFNQCDKFHMCDSVESKHLFKNTQTCECDDLCHLYGDCCVDKANETVADPGLFDSYIYKSSSCRYINVRTDTSKVVYVVSKCPNSYSEDYVRKSCEELADDNDMLLQVPVSESRFGIVFSNLYCAMCHGWSRNQVTFWTVQMDCQPKVHYPSFEDNIDPEYGAYDSDTLSLDNDIPPTLIDSPNITHGIDKNNFHSSTEHPTDVLDVQQLLNDSDCSHVFKLPDSIISPRPCNTAIISTCAPDWDNLTVLDRCLNDHQGLVWVHSHFTKLYRNKFCAICNNEDNFECQPLTFNFRVNKMFMDMNMPVSISVLLDFNSGTAKRRSDGAIQDSNDCSDGTLYDPFKDLCRPLVCSTRFTLKSGECIPQRPPISVVLHPQSNATSDTGMKPHSNITDRVAKPPSNFTGMVFNESNINMNCPMISIENEEYVLLENGSLYINQTQQIFLDGDYLHQNSIILICASNYNVAFSGNTEHILNVDIVQGMLSLCGQIISVIALLILLLIYAANPTLQNLPGKCLMSLSFSLFLAQLLFIVGMFIREFSYICKMTAILTHLFFLVSFFWMNVMAFDVWRTFHNQFQSGTLGYSKKFIVYACYASLIPLVIILFTSTIDHINVLAIPKPAYGIGLCWITNNQAILYFFALPLFVLLACNIILFSLAIWNIYKAQRGTEVLRKGKSNIKRKRLILSIKLSSIMGLTWIFGFLASVTDLNVIWYSFVFFNTLQGVFICIAFTCNKKVYRLTKRTVRRYTDRFSVTTSTNISHSTHMSTISTAT